MDVIKKDIFCRYLDREVGVRYHILDIKSSSGKVAHKRVTYFDCKYKIFCFGAVKLAECPCFAETLRLEHEINHSL
jgi:hypothetical protein